MALNARLNLRQSQTMMMTPQLLQSIRLLQLSHLELQQFIAEHVERNPLLEVDGASDQGPTEPDRPQQSDASQANWETADLETSSATIAENLGTSLENVFPDDPGRAEPRPAVETRSKNDGSSTIGSVGDAELSSIEDIASKPVSLRDHVADQIASLGLAQWEMLIAADIADTIDDRGYVEFDGAGLAQRLGCTQEDVGDVLEHLQSMEPAGLFARDLAECLTLQAKRVDRFDPAMEAVLANLDLLASRDFKSLKRIAGVPEADLFDILQEIRAMSPHPGRTFEDEPTIPVVHDVSVTVADDGGWRVELNPDALPRVLVNRQYHTTLTKSARGDEEKKFVSECYADATWLERSLDQRANTVLKVASEIVKRQDGFLSGGVTGLKPMTMKVIADAIKMHESTVSRVVANKYILTPRGLFEFRYFFTAAIAASDGGDDEHSSESVRQRIKQMIDTEVAGAVLSDDAIADALKKEGMDIARRTVAKYREALHIPSSVQRRREKKAAASRRDEPA
ncbi:MAG: RNA polymerase factor sigma-54 [Pseudomonadota bacterium]